MKIDSPAFIADNRTDRTIQAASLAFLALVLAMGIAVMAGYAAPWSPIGQARDLEEAPALVVTPPTPEGVSV